MAAHGRLTQEERVGDRAVARAAEYEGEDLRLARGERADPSRAGGGLEPGDIGPRAEPSEDRERRRGIGGSFFRPAEIPFRPREHLVRPGEPVLQMLAAVQVRGRPPGVRGGVRASRVQFDERSRMPRPGLRPCAAEPAGVGRELCGESARRLVLPGVECEFDCGQQQRQPLHGGPRRDRGAEGVDGLRPPAFGRGEQRRPGLGIDARPECEGVGLGGLVTSAAQAQHMPELGEAVARHPGVGVGDRAARRSQLGGGLVPSPLGDEQLEPVHADDPRIRERLREFGAPGFECIGPGAHAAEVADLPGQVDDGAVDVAAPEGIDFTGDDRQHRLVEEVESCIGVAAQNLRLRGEHEGERPERPGTELRSIARSTDADASASSGIPVSSVSSMAVTYRR